MTIPVLWMALSFAAGILLENFFRPPFIVLASLFFLLLPLTWVARGRRSFIPLTVSLFIVLGLAYAAEDKFRPSHAVEKWAGPDRVSLEGIVASPPEIQEKGRKKTASFTVDSRNLMRRNRAGAGREFFETEGPVQVFSFQPETVPEFGDLVRLSGTLERPKRAVNPGEFDYAHYLEERGIRTVFRSYGAYGLRVVRKNAASSWLAPLHRLRVRIARRIEDLFPEKDHAVFFKALILGIRKGLAPERREDFMKTGTAHLLAISGLNISLVAGTFYFLLMTLRLPQKPAAALSLVLVFAYALVAGFGLPVQRAAWMAGASFCALLLERERHTLNAFFLAFFILIAVNPRSLASVSFQLSFISVFSLVVLVPGWFDRLRWKEHVGEGFAVMAGTFPLIIYYFNIFSPLGMLANFLAIPLFHLALLLSSFTLLAGDFPVLGAVLKGGSEFFLEAGLLWIRGLAQLDWAYFYIPTPSPAQVVLYYALLFFLLVPRFSKISFPKIAGAFATGLWLISASSFFWPRTPPAFSLTLLAAGKNELAHIQFHPHLHWLVNAGRGFPSDQGQWIVEPYLREKGIKRLSALFVTDFYQKHTGGIPAVLRNFAADFVVYPRSDVRGAAQKIPFDWLKRKKINPLPVGRDDALRIGNAGEVRILGEVKHRLIFLVSCKDWDFLFLPAADRDVLKILSSYAEELPEIDGLILPSQPMTLSDLEQLYQMVMPDFVAVPDAGPLLKSYFAEQDIDYFDLAERGAVTFLVSAGRGRFLGRDVFSVIDNQKAPVL